MAVCILLIAWSPSRELETLPSDQPPASLALPLRRRRRRTARKLHISFTKRYVTYSIYTVQYEMLEDIFGEISALLFRICRFNFLFSLKYLLSVGFLSSPAPKMCGLRTYTEIIDQCSCSHAAVSVAPTQGSWFP